MAPRRGDRPIALVTGTTSGIGTALAEGLAAAGLHVVLHARDAKRGAALRDDLERRLDHPHLETLIADLARQDDVRALADSFRRRHDRLDVLVHNAGVYHPRFVLSPDGIEATLAVNHLAPFLLTRSLLPALEDGGLRNGPARIVTVASQAHHAASFEPDDPEMRRGYRGWIQYANTKLLNILWTRALARRLDASRIIANAYHPGVVRTRLGRETPGLTPLFQLIGTAPAKGADTGLWLALDPAMADATGGYYGRRRPAGATSTAKDDALAERVWTLSEGLVGGGRAGTVPMSQKGAEPDGQTPLPNHVRETS